MDTLIEYYDYFIEGLSLLVNFLLSDYPIVTGIILYILGIRTYLKILEKKPINYKSESAKHEIRSLSMSWEWLLFAIILGAYLIIKNI